MPWIDDMKYHCVKSVRGKNDQMELEILILDGLTFV